MDGIIKSLTSMLGHLDDLFSKKLVKKKDSKIIFAEFNNEKKNLAEAESHINELRNNLSLLQNSIENFIDGAFDKVKIFEEELEGKKAIEMQKGLIDTMIISLSKTLKELDHEKNMFILMIKKIERVIQKMQPLKGNKEDGTKNYFSDVEIYYKAFIVTYEKYEKNLKDNLINLKEEVDKVAQAMLENINRKKKLSNIPHKIKKDFRASFALCYLDLSRLEITFKDEYKKIKFLESMVKDHLE